MILPMRFPSFVLCFVLTATLPGLCPAQQTRFDAMARNAEAARTADRLQDAIRLYRQGVDCAFLARRLVVVGSRYYEQDRFPESQTALTRF